MRRGVTLIEAVVAIGLLLGFGTAVYGIVIQLARANAKAGERAATLAIANEQLEVIRNLPYASVGVVGGIPNGVLAASRQITRNNRTFTIATTVHNIDDSFDGTIGGSPNDTAPADYKRAEVTVNCQGCTSGTQSKLTTVVAPNGLEIGTNNGALFVRVINALGQPVSGATVTVVNNSVSPAVNLVDVTNTNGELQLIDVPPSVASYQITTTKSGYSTDQTLTATVPNPNPVKPHATVAVGQVTQLTFAIDTLANLSLTTMNSSCTPISGVGVRLDGTKLVGTNPDVLKYTETTTSPFGGVIARTLEWDTYNAVITSLGHALIGTVGTLPVNLLPSGTQNISLILGSPTAHGLHVTVKNGTTQLPLTDAMVQVTKAGYDQTFVTGRGYLLQSNWVGGSGQDAFTDETKYESDDGNVDVSSAGQLSLRESGGVYQVAGTLTSSTFDTGGATNYVALSWAPISQPLEAGTSSVRLQLATNNDGTTWDYLGPDGTSGTYYSVSNTSIHAALNGNRYLRYRLYLTTEDTTVTPVVSDVAISFTSSCVPPGQVFFSGLSDDTYQVTTSAAGYDTDAQSIPVDGWTHLEVLLSPS